MGISPTTAATLFFLASHLQLTLGLNAPPSSTMTEIRGIRSHLLDDKTKLNILQQLEQTSGDAMTVVAFLQSTYESIVANPNEIQQTIGGIQSLTTYLNDSGVQMEIDKIENPRLADNLAILSVVQKHILNGTDRRDALLSDMTIRDLTQRFTMEEAGRYVKYALAAYGDDAIEAADMDLSDHLDLRQGNWTRRRISEHVGIPEDDLILMDVDYSGNITQLRHFLAVDHQHRKVVFCIRGTFCASECAIDLEGYSRPFCGGEAHAGFSLMAERLWTLRAMDVLKLLKENQGYELIVTGHSLGAGVTLLLNIMLHQDDRLRGIQFRAFAYASPPVYAPLSQVPQAVLTAVNYMHDNDDVPLLSGDAVRHLVAALTAVDNSTKDMDLVDKGKLILGTERPSAALTQRTREAFRAPLVKKRGMPMLIAPAMCIAWARKVEDTEKFDLKLCDPLLLAKSSIYIDPGSPLDHFPSRYEQAFTNVMDPSPTMVPSRETGSWSHPWRLLSWLTRRL